VGKGKGWVGWGFLPALGLAASHTLAATIFFFFFFTRGSHTYIWGGSEWVWMWMWAWMCVGEGGPTCTWSCGEPHARGGKGNITKH